MSWPSSSPKKRWIDAMARFRASSGNVSGGLPRIWSLGDERWTTSLTRSALAGHVAASIGIMCDRGTRNSSTRTRLGTQQSHEIT